MSAQIINFAEYQQWAKATQKVNLIRKMLDIPPITVKQFRQHIEQVERELERAS